jgi:hypothetical protein
VLFTCSRASAQPLPEPSATDDVELGFRTELRLGNVIVPKNGVPNALRAGLAAGLSLRFGRIAFAADAAALFGTSDKNGWSAAVGADLEAEWLPARIALGLHLSTGARYFVSEATEDRRGPAWRAGIGVRLLLPDGWTVGLLPLAVERLPDGPGPYTPLRSRWAWEVTWLTVGFRR